MPDKIEGRLAELGVELPTPAAPAANYVPYVVTGKLVFVAGQLPVWNGERKFAGQLGRELGIEEGRQSARICALNNIAQIKAACGGNLDRVVRCVKLTGFVASAANFYDHPQVLNGASDVIAQIFGPKGQHARAAVGVTTLPFGLSVEIESVWEID
jgi:enamine deaminase RidA (YjgF/YER057c/UK114 family)